MAASALLVAGLLLASAAAEQTFRISTTWNGEAIEDREPATVTLSAGTDGGLLVQVSADFFNSPIPSEQPLVGCPERSYYGLWNYEVVELFLLNDDNQYLEIELSPHGRYILLLLDGERNTVLHSLPLFPDGVLVENPCLGEDTNCTRRWSASVVIPSEYIPKDVTRFNAYAIHGNNLDEEFPEEANKTYEALFPNTNESFAGPDFHYLDAFDYIDWTAIGYDPPSVLSDLWATAVENGDFTREYSIVHAVDCVNKNASAEYDAKVVISKNSSENVFELDIQVTEENSISFNVPPDLQEPGVNFELSPDHESMWISFSNDVGDQLRFGINPFGAYRVELWRNEQLISNVLQLPGEDVDRCSQTGNSSWSCLAVALDWQMLPPNVTHFQIIHAHMSLVHADDSSPAPDYEFEGAVCPGRPDGVTDLDWKGCDTDNKLVVDPSHNFEYSDLWLEAETESPVAPGAAASNSASFLVSLIAVLILRHI